MTTEAEREVYRALRESQNRYTYFVLAAAGAGIALAVRETSSAGFEWPQIPLAVAAIVWGLSFFCGCRNSALVSSTLYANLELLRVLDGQHPEVGPNQNLIAPASEGIRRAIEANSESANRVGHWQFRLLVLGAALYLAWHLLEMYLRTN